MLALAETGDRSQYHVLLAALKAERAEVAWAAADALIALNDRRAIRDARLVRRDAERSPLGAHPLHAWPEVAEEALEIKSSGLRSQRPDNIGRAMDIMWYLSPQPGDVAYLKERLRAILDSDARHPETLGPWANEWLQRRLVRMLTKLGVVSAMLEITRLLAHIDQRAPSESPERPGLIKAIQDAAKQFEVCTNP